MKNRNQTATPATRRRTQRIDIRQTHPAYRLMPKAPQHDLLVLGFYPGMGRNSPQADHPTAA